MTALGLVSDATTTVSTNSVNDAPVLGGATASSSVNDNATLSPFSSFTVSDADSIQAQTLTVTLNNPANGSLSNLGTGSYSNGVYTFRGTAAEAQTAIRSLIFTPTANHVNVGLTESTNFTVSIIDGGGLTASNTLTTVVATSINDAPVLGGAVASQAVNDNASRSPFTGFTISDADSSQIQTITVTLDNPAKGSLSNLGTGTYVNGVYSIESTAADAQIAVRNLLFTPTPNRVATGSSETTIFTVSVNDGTLLTPVSNNTTTVIATSVNDAPVLGGATALTSIGDNVTATPFTSFTITDLDSPAQLQTLTVTLDNPVKGTLSSSVVGGSYTPSTGVYKFTGTAADAQAAIQSLVFTPTPNRVAVGTVDTTTFTVNVNDGTTSSTNTTTTVATTSVNDAPVLSASPSAAGQGVNDNATLSPFLTFNISDADTTQVQTITVTLSDATKGVLTSSTGAGSYAGGVYTFIGSATAAQTAVRGLVFTPAINHIAVNTTETTTFTVAINDNTVLTPVTDSTTSVIATSINDAPIVGGAVANQAVNDNASLTPFLSVNTSFTLTDADASQAQTVTVTLDNPAKGALTVLGTGAYDVATGTYTFKGTAAEAQTALHNLVFVPTPN